MQTKATSLIKILLLNIFLVAPQFVKSQTFFLSLQVARDVSGSGLGGNVCPNIALTLSKHTVSFGPNFQRKRMNFSGLQFNYRYSAAKNEKLELFFSVNIIRHENAFLSKVSCEIEENSHLENPTILENKKFKVVECYAGIGLKVNLTKNLNIACSSGIGMYYTCNKDYDNTLYREKSAVVMQLRLILIYNLVRRNTSTF